MKDLDICGLGNAIVDVLVQVDEPLFASTEFKRGGMSLADAEQQRELHEKVKHLKLSMVSGGSVANSIVATAQLGAKAALNCSIGSDRFGLHYQEEFKRLGITLSHDPLDGKQTGTCFVLITPDAERTMRTFLGVNTEFGAAQVSEDLIKRSRWLFVEGYLFATPGGQEAITRAIDIARQTATKVAVTFSESWVVSTQRAALQQALRYTDLVFANEGEACTYAETDNVEEAFKRLTAVVPHVAVTAGPKGALVQYEGETKKAAAFPCQPKDLTGAGDMFAAALLYGIISGVPLEKAARGACYLAMKVISQIGARLSGGVRDDWESCLAG